MKKTLVLLSSMLILTSCVTEKKYKELEQKYYAALKDRSDSQVDKKSLSELQKEYKRLKTETQALEEKERLLNERLKNLDKEHENLRNANNKKIKEIQGDLAKKNDRIKELESLIAKQKEALSKLKSTLQNALKGYEGKGITVEEKNGNIYVSMENKLLFESAKWTVGTEGIKALKDLSPVLKANRSFNVIIEGHTDTDKYHPSTEIKDNWDLSVMRATSIIKILQKEGISTKQMTASGRAEFLPISSNTSAEGKAKNRRVDIIIAPNLDQINKLLNEL